MFPQDGPPIARRCAVSEPASGDPPGPAQLPPTLPGELAPVPQAPEDRAADHAAGMPPVPGYAILGSLGGGGMGIVYKARHRALDRDVALKMIKAGDYAGEEQLRRLRSEGQALARLNHPNVVQVYDVGEYEGRPFLALEFVAGGSLAQKAGGKPLPPEEGARVVEVIARAVQAAHGVGVIHRDLKPANVLLTA